MKTLLRRAGSAARARRARVLVLTLCSVGFSGWAALQAAEPAARIVRVEEDWELVVETPHSNSSAPQIVCAFSPVGHFQSLHATFELNHQSLPEFVAGGLQLQIWDGESPLQTRKFPSPALLSNPGETIRWTQVMELADGELTFRVINGASTTWGAFGGEGYLKAVVPVSLTDLNAYHPAVSTGNSGVSYAANLVRSLVLKKVRLIDSNGQVLQDATARVVHPLN